MNEDRFDEIMGIVLGPHDHSESALRHAAQDLLLEVNRIRQGPAPLDEYGQKYSGGDYLVRVPSEWRDRLEPIPAYIKNHSMHGGHVGKRTIIVISDWEDIT